MNSQKEKRDEFIKSPCILTSKHLYYLDLSVGTGTSVGLVICKRL